LKHAQRRRILGVELRNGALQEPMIFSMYLQVGDFDRSLSFYRDGLGLEVAWNDDMLAVLRGAGETEANLVLREVGGDAKQPLGHAGVTRIGWQVTSLADLDSAEERLTRHGTQYQRVDGTDGGRIVTHDPDGLSVILFLPGEPSLAGKPPPFMYWYR
jgi:catechol 2,3-dioxygenase-like lactoylglutathione lyase family enzyme